MDLLRLHTTAKYVPQFYFVFLIAESRLSTYLSSYFSFATTIRAQILMFNIFIAYQEE